MAFAPATDGAAMGSAVATGGLPWVVTTGIIQLESQTWLSRLLLAWNLKTAKNIDL